MTGWERQKEIGYLLVSLSPQKPILEPLKFLLHLTHFGLALLPAASILTDTALFTVAKEYLHTLHAILNRMLCS